MTGSLINRQIVMFYFKKRFQLLALPSFRWYLINCLLGTFGGGLSYVAMSWLILQADNSVSAVAILMLCFWVPNVIFGPFLGVIADRYSRKWLIILANGVRAVTLIGFGGYLQYHLDVTVMYALMAVLGVCFSMYFPAAIALIRQIVTEEDLLYANSTIDIAYELGNVVGMGVAGLLIALFSTATVIFMSGVLFAFCAVSMIFVKIKVTTLLKENMTYHLLDDFKLGLNYLFTNSRLLIIYSVQLLILVGFMTTPILLAPFSKNVLHANVVQFGYIDAALSVGVVVGGLFIPVAAMRLGLIRILVYMCLALAVFFVLFSINRSITGAEVLYFLIGVGLSVWPLIVTRAQHVTHIDFQARVQSVFNSLSGVLIIIIYFLVDMGSHFVSVDILYLFEVIMTLFAALLLWRYRSLLHVGGEDKIRGNSFSA